VRGPRPHACANAHRTTAALANVAVALGDAAIEAMDRHR
jgi:hypothetical protein